MDGCALVSTNGGWNLAIGAFPRATGRFETLRATDGCRDVTGQVQQDRCWLGYGIEQIREHPWHWLSLVPAKLGFTFDHESFAVEYLHEAMPQVWPEDRRARIREFTTLAHRILVAAAALGCIGFPLGRSVRPRALATQATVLIVAAALGGVALLADSPAFWPLVVFTAITPWLPLYGRPPFPPALLLGVALLGTLIVTHAILLWRRPVPHGRDSRARRSGCGCASSHDGRVIDVGHSLRSAVVRGAGPRATVPS